MSLRILPLKTPTLPPATHTNCYQLGDTLIDPASPYPEEQDRLWEWLEGRPIHKILLTHHHGDHIGGVEDIQRRTQAKVYAHRDGSFPFHIDHFLEDGARVDTGAGSLIAYHTPGHADGHLCYGVDGGLVVGDLVASVGTIVLIPPEGHLQTYLGSLERMAALGGCFYPAHGAPIEDGPALVAQYIAHRHMRTHQVQAALSAGARDAAEIVAQVYAGIPGVNPWLAEMQVRTHLQYLKEKNLLPEGLLL